MKFSKIPAIIIAIVTLALISIYAVPSSVYSNSTVYKANFTDDRNYVCPMHPDITSDKPGTCSVCGMDLVKKEDGKSMDMEKCKQTGCEMDKCKGETGGCTNECMEKCTNMKDHKDMNMKDHDCKDKCPMMKEKSDMKMDDSKCKSKCDHK
jgi:hypothetical protein